jgi:hypothetical protein
MPHIHPKKERDRRNLDKKYTSNPSPQLFFIFHAESNGKVLTDSSN